MSDDQLERILAFRKQLYDKMNESYAEEVRLKNILIEVLTAYENPTKSKEIG